MGYWNSWRTRKFYQEQVDAVLALIKRKFTYGKVGVETYLKICEQTGEEPDPEKMPPEMVDFPFEVQMAFLIHNLLPDRWDGMSGSYMGKDWSAYGALLDIYEIVDKKETTYFVKAIESENSKVLNDELSNKRKAQERASKASTGGISSSNVKRK